MKRILFLISVISVTLLTAQSVFAQLSITTTNDTSALINAFLGGDPDPRITITDVQVEGDQRGFGTYTSGPLGIGDGIILASGAVTNALPPNNSGSTTTDFNLPGCDECDSLIPGYESYDATILTITFDVGNIDGIRFDFIFGSEEYPEWVGSAFNDVYGAFLNGTQISFDENGNPITINGPWFSGSNVIVPPANGMEYDGSTTLLTSAGTIAPSSIGNVLRLVICDAGDHILDSGVLLSKLRGCVGDNCEGPAEAPLVKLSPVFETNCVETLHTLTATVAQQDGTPIAGVNVDFEVIEGPHSGATGSAITNNNGVATWGYTGTDAGLDTIEASVTIQNEIYKSELVQKEWIDCLIQLYPVEYRWGIPAPGYSFANWPIFEGWMDVRIENRGAGDAFNVIGSMSSCPPNTTIFESDITVGYIPSGDSAWSSDTFETHVDMANPVDPCAECFWTIEYDDAAGVHHVVENVPEFPPGEGPPSCP